MAENSISRNLSHRDFRDKSFLPITTALGELTLAWNDLHENLGHVFWSVSGIKNGLIALTMWYSIPSDRAQKEMLKSFMGLRAIGLEIHDDIRTEVMWLLKEAVKLEEKRNDALHSPMVSQSDGSVIPFHGLGHKRAQKLKDKDLIREFRWFYDTVTVLRDYAHEIQCSLVSDSAPWPDRPQLPNRGDTK